MQPITGDRLIELIPQKPPFVLVSSLNEVSEIKCKTTFVFDDKHVLCDNGQLTPAGIMENIAQTAAAKMGYECALQQKKIPIGFIGDVRDFSFTRLPTIGEEITTELIVENKIFDVEIVMGNVWIKEEKIANCKMKIFVESEKLKADQTV